MFQPSGPDHMRLSTVQNSHSQHVKVNFVSIQSLKQKVKVKARTNNQSPRNCLKIKAPQGLVIPIAPLLNPLSSFASEPLHAELETPHQLLQQTALLPGAHRAAHSFLLW